VRGARDTSVGIAAGDRRWLALMFVLAGGWSLALLVMDATTARPRVISRDQVLSADAVVIARRDSEESDQIRVERVFRGPVAEGDSLRVVNLDDVRGMAADQEYVLALSKDRKDYAVTTLKGQRDVPLVYASSPETVEEIKAILRDQL
jgi:hypothetical protein